MSHTPVSTPTPTAIVVGGGIIGLSTAWELLGRGWDVTVYDPAPASAASRAAAGMLAPAAEVVWGQHPLYPLLVDSAAMYPEFVAKLASASPTVSTPADLGYLESETLVVGTEPADRAALDELAEVQAGLGLRVERLTASRARRLEPALAPGISGGVYLPDDHQIDPRKVTAALLAVLGERVVRRAVTRLVRRDGDSGPVIGVALDPPARVGAEEEFVPADEVVVCTGLDRLAGMPELPLRPVHGDILRLRIPEYARPLVRRTVRGLVHGRAAYLVPRADGTLVLGASSREDGNDEVSTEAVFRLLDDAARMVPGILDSRLLETMARARPGSPDDVPLVGRLEDGLTVSTGYFRHGVLLTPLGAKTTADIVAGATDTGGGSTRRGSTAAALLTALDPLRFSRNDVTTPMPGDTVSAGATLA